MAKGIHKGSEFSNVNETWNQNERNRQGSDSSAADERTTNNDLEQVIKEEATEYDNVNKEERVLSGDRATVRDEPGSPPSDE